MDLNASSSWPQQGAYKLQEAIAMRLLNARVLPREALNRKFFFGPFLPKTRVLERCVLERKRKQKSSAQKTLP